MSILGIRCSSKDFSFSIVKGKQDSVTLVDSGTITFPKGYSESDTLKWLSQEIEGIIKKHQVHGIGIKGVEPMGMKGKSYGARMEKEGIIFLQASLCGIKYIKRKVKSTIAKDLGMKGKGKYLETKADFSGISGYDSANKNTQESIQVAVSMLN
jgi:Holliday junction resolvasome RuvABC endonuclease subunit